MGESSCRLATSAQSGQTRPEMEKVAVVTGANKGLGYELVKGLCERFFGRVYLTSRDEKRGTEACEKLKNEGLSPEYHQLDITNSESIKKFVYFIQNKHGLIDLLINNAGILFLKDAQEPKSEQVDNTLLVNFDSVVSFTELMLPYIKEDGIILNISSSSGHLSRIPSDEIKKKLANPGLTLAELDELVQDYKDAVKNGSDEEMWGSSPYVVSKVALNAYTFILNRRLSDKEINESKFLREIQRLPHLRQFTGTNMSFKLPKSINIYGTTANNYVIPLYLNETPLEIQKLYINKNKYKSSSKKYFLQNPSLI
ncbi:carbonyl reductase [NADPH] 3-like [Leptidea sinapis]|uniref:carbonyl reductase [NADPH] 3-like n=1 Tax=Leptidea sinapis TaxID=189913 RepID=UPI00212529C2|nr:carbonyl reductase [NADPH] 3-like [Leptidea sinapis]